MSNPTDPPQRPTPGSTNPLPVRRRQPVGRTLAWLAVAGIIAFAGYRLKFRPLPVTTHRVTVGEVRGEVMDTGTLEARVKTTINPPTSGQIRIGGRQVMELFARVAHEHGTAFIVVTHDARALDVFDRTVHMEDGRLKNGNLPEG